MSSYVVAAPEVLAAASADLSGIGQAIKEANAAAAPSTTGIAPPALDEVSAAISKLFGSYGQEFQALTSQAGRSITSSCSFELRRDGICGCGGGQCDPLTR